MQLLVKWTNRYCNQYLDMPDKGHDPLSDMNIQKMYLISSIIVQMGHDQSDILKDHWSTLQQFLWPFIQNK
jgi:hypothetical protein